MLLVESGRSSGRAAPGSRRRPSEQLRHPDQIVARHRQREAVPHTVNPAHFHLGHASDGLRPAERLFDQLSLPLAHGIGRVPRRARIDGRVTDLGRDVRRHAHLTVRSDEAPCIVAFVCGERQAPFTAWRIALDHSEGRLTLGPARRLGRVNLDDEAVPVLCQRVTDVAELRGRVGTLAVQLGVRIGRLFPVRT